MCYAGTHVGLLHASIPTRSRAAGMCAQQSFAWGALLITIITPTAT